MLEIKYIAPFVVTILGVSYPILFQIIAKIDDKYNSIIVLEIFEREKVKAWYLGSLKFAIFAIFLWSIGNESVNMIFPFPMPELSLLVSRILSSIVILSVLILIYAFFKFVNKIVIYYTPNKFIKYLMSKHDGEFRIPIREDLIETEDYEELELDL